MNRNTIGRTLLLSLMAILVALPAFAGPCRTDSDVQWFLEERDREEATLMAAWINSQITPDQIIPLAAQIMAWETRVATTCNETRFISEHVHLLTLESVDVETIPGRLFLAMMERNGMRGLTAQHGQFPEKTVYQATRRVNR